MSYRPLACPDDRDFFYIGCGTWGFDPCYDSYTGAVQGPAYGWRITKRDAFVRQDEEFVRSATLTFAYKASIIEPVKARLFPETFEYVYKGHDGVETTTTQVLFGDLVAAVEETIDHDSVEDSGTKDFKPGTNAQRHRLQQGPGRSSRLADLTSMVRESFRASFRRVNESSTDEPAASSAKLPADHRRLS